MKFLVLLLILACSHPGSRNTNPTDAAIPIPELWKQGETPIAPPGFEVIKFATNLKNPEWAYETPGGDILVTESSKKDSADQITLLRDTDNDGKPELRSVFLTGLKQPLGMLIIGNWFYVANTDSIWRWPYQEGMTAIKGEGQKIADLPSGCDKQHWMRSMVSSEGNSKLFVGIGSASDVGEDGLSHEQKRANVITMDIDGKNQKVYASGLRNPVGMDWHPHTGALWVVVNERDHLGDDSPEDYMTVIKQDHFYGWPYYYWGKTLDPKWKGKVPKSLSRVAVPHLKLGAHSGVKGLTFYRGKAFGPKYRSGAFITQYGSEYSSTLKGYKVVFVPFSKGFPAGPPEDFLTGFLAGEGKTQVRGRPFGVLELNRGELLVCDDIGNTLWVVRSKDELSNFE
jgi:glucose/arabinose dehydrogenase